MSKNFFSIKIDASRVRDLADRVGQIDDERLGDMVVGVLNEVVETTYDLARNRIRAGINLTDTYVQARMEVKPATPGNPQAQIIGKGGKQYLTNLSHYGADVVSKDVNWSNETILSRGKKFGRYPGWTERIGAQHMGIDPDEKLRKMTVKVTNTRKSVGKAFTLPGKLDREGNPLVFKAVEGTYGAGSSKRNTEAGFNRRKGRSKIEALYGPSVYQLFRVAAGEIAPGVSDDLENAVVQAAERELQKVIS